MLVAATSFAAVLLFPGSLSADDASRDALIAHLDATARARLATRAKAVAGLRTQADAERRQAFIRATVLELLGGLPAVRGDLAVRHAGGFDAEGFRVERVVYDSLPGLHVTANVFVPAGAAGPFPAILLSPGHSPGGKTELFEMGAILARNGFVALAWDPIGQGERLQHFDPDLGGSKVGRPTGEHGHDGVHAAVIGQHVARYFVWDAMRGLDYLSSRGDVDASRLGAFGCSGGGTVTAYLAALDPRVAAAATACYITSFEQLLATAGPQDGEQSIPGFISAGLDFGDWIAAAAPRPYAVVSTTEDMFPFAGARQTVEEATRFYGLFGAADRLQWITGPGGHGALQPILGDIVRFFSRSLRGRDEAALIPRVTPPRPEDVLCTETGQVSTSLRGATIHSLVLHAAASLPAPPVVASRTELETLRGRIERDVRRLASIGIAAGAAPRLEAVAGESEREGYRLQSLSIASRDGMALPLLVATPLGEGRKPAVLLIDGDARSTLERPGTDLERLARSGHVVVALSPRPDPPGTEELKSPLLGTSYLLSLRALLVGETLLGLRVDDALAAMGWVSAREDVAPARITAYGRGAGAAVVLHAAALDARIGHVIVENGLAAYRLIVEQPLHRNAPEVLVPGALPTYDLPDLALAVSPRRVTVIAPVDAVGVPMREAAFRRAWARVLEADRTLGTPDRVRITWRAPRDPLPVE